MNCAQHTEIAATAYCRECGRPMCPECQHAALGSVYCDVHAPAEPMVSEPPAAAPYMAPDASPASPYVSLPAPSPYTAPAGTPYAGPAGPDDGVHPVLALLLGLIPGVGAIYNGQYAKGLVHAVVFGLLVTTIANANSGGLADRMTPFLGIMIGALEFYMAFEAYHTARKRRYGVTVEEFGSQFDFRGGRGSFPAGAILLIGLGFILLLDTTDIISIDDFGKYWPIGLIVLGIYLLYNRLSPDHRAERPRNHTGNDAEARR